MLCSQVWIFSSEGEQTLADYDIIVAGGGSAGCVLAAELSADPKLKVLLIEAGRRDTNPWIHIPATFFKVMRGGRDAIVYEGEPETGLGGRPFLVPQGYVLGGGSSVNAMLYIRGQSEDYEACEAAGAAGWGWRDVLPVFKRLEANRNFGEPFHGRDGPLAVSDPRHRHPLSKAFLAACNEAQLRLNPDFNGERQDGVGFYQTTTNKGRRWSSARAFLRPALKRGNLTVMTQALVDRVLIENGRATGVRLVDGREITTRREVVLTAGALASPLILMRSGPGAGDKLDALGIPVLRPSVSRIMRDLEKRGLVTPAKSTDRRHKPWRITPAGREIFDAVAIKAEAVYREIEAAYGSEELRDLVQRLNRLVDLCEALPEDVVSDLLAEQ